MTSTRTLTGLALLAGGGFLFPAKAEQPKNQFYQQQMLGAPVLPASQSAENSCQPANTVSSSTLYKTAAMVDYKQANWQARVAADWQYFAIPKSNGKVLIIDHKQFANGLGYRYLANNTENDLYEPWSSSKIQAFTAAVAKVRSQHPTLGADSSAGDTPLSDLITSINSYEVFGKADGDSNAIASYFINVAGRDYLTGLFNQDWLKLADPRLKFNGAYASKVFSPSDDQWYSADKKYAATVSYFKNNQDDPNYLSYRCDDCALTGNKAMTTLAQAEWLKRLASHQREPLTQMPHLTTTDVDVLFNGPLHQAENAAVGGMQLGISQLISRALAKVIAPNDKRSAKAILDDISQGQWRIWQKIGWGPSETRAQAETVMLAHVCLPHYQGGREFTLAMQSQVAGAKEENIAVAGKLIADNLHTALLALLNPSKATN